VDKQLRMVQERRGRGNSIAVLV